MSLGSLSLFFKIILLKLIYDAVLIFATARVIWLYPYMQSFSFSFSFPLWLSQNIDIVSCAVP